MDPLRSVGCVMEITSDMHGRVGCARQHGRDASQRQVLRHVQLAQRSRAAEGGDIDGPLRRVEGGDPSTMRAPVRKCRINAIDVSESERAASAERPRHRPPHPAELHGRPRGVDRQHLDTRLRHEHGVLDLRARGAGVPRKRVR